MASGDVKIQAGQYWLDKQTWFDLRLTDSGWVLSLCDVRSNTRYTALIDNGNLVLGEVAALITPETAAKMATQKGPEEEPPPLAEDVVEPDEPEEPEDPRE